MCEYVCVCVCACEYIALTYLCELTVWHSPRRASVRCWCRRRIIYDWQKPNSTTAAYVVFSERYSKYTLDKYKNRKMCTM